MKKHLLRVTLLSLALCLLATTTALSSETAIPAKKQTVLGKYITAKEAYEMFQNAPENTKILDVRTFCEYVFVGHAPMAVNIPLMFLEPGLNESKKLIMPPNQNFITDIEKRFKKDDTILVMCRSGARSAACINKIASAGFTNVYNIIDGFEGDKDENGKRTVNGWINSGAPWTYDLEPELVYSPK
ncbi:Rhodanese-like domain protein [Desulfamplus magnetovallimortis]|uniref:Rhodanese-like domain protein n=1 Tax=Desulfamplus magnetovallimortis TaxID=1246637 RepID=A0A1W1HD96_9BACT|nr:rhodanese-like domain-containing protein [Desulfamplus magnetovallimortis]SLM30464.1 Rhodanese-like domain protein [Desulfamplus magnetovallimortis]